MGKLSMFAISFNQDKTVYTAGEMVSGQLIVQLAQSMEMQALKLTFAGKALVCWTESRTVNDSDGKSHTETTTYSANETLFDQSVVLQGQGSTNPGNSLPQGQHVFPFQFQLPPMLPTSFEDSIGHIRYYVKGTIVKPWKFNHNTKRVFTVLNSVDLNAIPSILVPSGASESKSLCCCCCRSGPIEVDFHTDRSGYVPGEWIMFTATLTNLSTSRVKMTSVHLVQKVTYHATGNTRVETKEIVSVFGPDCLPRNTLTWNDAKIQIPPLPPTDTTRCRILFVEYLVMFQCHLRTCAVNLRCYAPITIGTIPSRSLAIYSRNVDGPPPSVPLLDTTLINLEPTAPAITAASPPPEPTFSTLPPPPSYAAATSGGVNIRDAEDNQYTMGEAMYTPQYTYYDWNQSAFTYNK